MTRGLFVKPYQVRSSGKVSFKPIPVNQYNNSFEKEVKKYGKENLLRIYRDMLIIRTFEEMLLDVSIRGIYKGIQYKHLGPAHLSIGQEASAVGQAYLLGVNDFIFGGHRSHGEILAKGLSAIEKLTDDEVLKIMQSYMDGDCLKIVEEDFDGTVSELAIDYLIYGTIAEVFHRHTGLNRGMGGSMHAFFPPFGIYPNNAIVGASVDIAVGTALYKHINKQDGIVICNIGDGAVSCGPVWEGLCFANMDQFKELWGQEYRGGLPFILNIMNNFYAMGGQPVGETMGFKTLARIGAGLNPDQMNAETVDGYNPLAVIDVVERKKELIEKGKGPVLLETITYRLSGHSPSDASTYRDREEIDAWREVDPIITFKDKLIDMGLATKNGLSQMAQEIEEKVFKAYKKAADCQISPTTDLSLREETLFSNLKIANLDESRSPEVAVPRNQNPRVKKLAKLSRSAFDENGRLLPKDRCITIRDAIFEAVIHAFYTDSTLIAYGEDNRDWGGAFAVYRGLTESLPYRRFFNSPIAEGAIVGTAVGYALAGGRALVELMYCDFLGRCGDEVFNQLPKWQAMSAGTLRMPVVVRLMVGSRYGAQHSQDWTSLCTHIPGLKVVFPATPYDAKGLMNSALKGTDPVVFFEHQRLYDVAEQFAREGVPAGYYEIPIGEPDIKKEGKDLTMLTIGPTLYQALGAAKTLEEKYNISCEIIDARSIVPFKYERVIESVKNTGKIILASDACERGNILQTMAAKINQFAFDYMDAPAVVVGARNWLAPHYEAEHEYLPFASRLIDAVHEHITPLNGYNPTHQCSNIELMRRSAHGV